MFGGTKFILAQPGARTEWWSRSKIPQQRCATSCLTCREGQPWSQLIRDYILVYIYLSFYLFSIFFPSNSYVIRSHYIYIYILLSLSLYRHLYNSINVSLFLPLFVSGFWSFNFLNPIVRLFFYLSVHLQVDVKTTWIVYVNRQWTADTNCKAFTYRWTYSYHPHAASKHSKSQLRCDCRHNQTLLCLGRLLG